MHANMDTTSRDFTLGKCWLSPTSDAPLPAMAQEIEIRNYEDWMKPQVLAMFRAEYGVDENSFEAFFNHLYEHSFQQGKCIRLVAVEGEKLAGFQSFFYWPYTLGSTTYYSLQSGNTLVDKDYRGKGIFQRLINHLFENTAEIPADFIMGFPVQASYKGFIKNKWTNLFNLQWYVKIINPLAFLIPLSPGRRFKTDFQPIPQPTDRIKLSESEAFVGWKKQLNANQNKRYYFSASVAGDKRITFELTTQVRKRILKELVIGKIYFEPHTEPHLSEAMQQLLREARKTWSITMVSIAINEQCTTPNYHQVVNNLGFRKINKEIYFIIRPLKTQTPAWMQAAQWDIGRADIDTW